jgi:hypothetical protein
VESKGKENIFSKLISENFLNLEKEVVIQVQKSVRTTNRQHKKKMLPCYIILKTLDKQNRERILKAATKDQVTYKAHPSE